MAFRGIQTKARNDPLGPGGLSLLSQNMQWVRNLASTEHIISSGEHNAWQVPRRVFNVPAAGTSTTPTTSDVQIATSPATGTYTLTLAPNRFSTDIRPQLNVNSDQVITKPCIIGFTVTSATSISFYLKQLSSALGGGNAWAALNMDFDVALHSDPLAVGNFVSDQAGHARGETLTEAATDWNAHVQAHGDMQTMLTTAHTSVGVHNVAEVAKYYAQVAYNPTTARYEVQASTDGAAIAVNRVSTGVVEVTYNDLSTPTFAFVSPDYQRLYAGGTAADVFNMNARFNTKSKHIVYIYKYDSAGNTWNYGDADFFIALHGS
jgi:hypothetical protein